MGKPSSPYHLPRLAPWRGYGELETGKIPTGPPQLRFKDVCKRDLQALGINTDFWEVTATDREPWRHTVKLGLSQQIKAEEKRLCKKTVCLASRPTTAFTCSKYGKDCHSRIGLHSHKKTLHNGCKSLANVFHSLSMIPHKRSG